MRGTRGRSGWRGTACAALAITAGLMTQASAPVLQPRTLEDIYGDTGNRFQAALGFVTFEGTPQSQSQQSYGTAVDDMVIKWREISLAPDEAACSSGSCASIEFTTSNVFEGRTVFGIVVVESTPSASNDCNLDGTPDIPADQDCDNDGIRDLVVKVSSQVDPGEIVYVNQTAPPDGPEYRGSVAISSLTDAPGVVFIVQHGAEVPLVTATYIDSNDGTGVACPNNVDPAKHGIVQAATAVFLGPVCEIQIVKAQTQDNGDHDVFVDTDETVSMKLRLVNNCGMDLHHCTARISSNSPTVACILDPVIDLGNLADSSAIVTTAEAFMWRMSSAQRTSLAQDLAANFNVTVTCDEIDGLSVPQWVSLQLDFDADDAGQVPQPWIEGFESGTLGKFLPENLDAGIPGNSNAEGLINGDGWRCQYNDPDSPQTLTFNSPQALDCYPGSSLAASNAVYWRVDGTTTGSPDGGRAWNGNYAMRYGLYTPGAAANMFTTPLAVVESVRTSDPINLGLDFPQLSFWHQVSLVDDRALGSVPPLRSGDRGVVEIQEANAAGVAVTDWMRSEPYQNAYDEQAVDNFYNCTFDPVDDGNTEDDFFDPADPNRRLGPSSTCYPAFVWDYLGDTDAYFQVANVGHATTPPLASENPALNGGYGRGTWVKSKIELSDWRGKRVRLRFLVTSVKISPHESWQQAFAFPANNPADDGWWIDQVQVDQTLTNPAQLLTDTGVLHGCAGNPAIGCLAVQDCIAAGTTGPCNQPAPPCGPICTSITADVATTPDATPGSAAETLTAPGQPIQIDASSSSGTCLSGVLQFRFSVQGGAVLREWSDNPVWIDAPQADTDYRIEVRCSTAPSCGDSLVVDVDVNCPASGNLGAPFGETILAQADKLIWSWITSRDFDVWGGPLGSVGSYAGALYSGSGASFTLGGVVPACATGPGGGCYYVVRQHGEFCNDSGLWTGCPNGPDDDGDACETAQSNARESALP